MMNEPIAGQTYEALFEKMRHIINQHSEEINKLAEMIDKKTREIEDLQARIYKLEKQFTEMAMANKKSNPFGDIFK